MMDCEPAAYLRRATLQPLQRIATRQNTPRPQLEAEPRLATQTSECHDALGCLR